MPTVQLPANNWRPRWYQKPAWDAWENGVKRQLLVWHRRAGKDELNLHQHAVAAHTRIGNYWHMLPQQSQARKALWHAVNPITGKRRIFDAFPAEVVDSILENEMLIKFKIGSTFQVLGSDNFNSAVGAPPVGITFSEWALADPQAWAYLSPILTENGGWASFISTPRGANHLKRMHDGLKNDPSWFVEVLGVDKTHAVSEQAIADQLKEYTAMFGEDIAAMLIEQEFFCSWAGASVGSILAREIDKAEREGRITDDIQYVPDGAPVDISADIGFYDTCSWWFWQRERKRYKLLKYTGFMGLDADDYIGQLQDTLREKGWKLGTIYLPPDAKAKTFSNKRSVMERFLLAFGEEHVRPIEASKQMDQVNAARVAIKDCWFNETECTEGISGLRGWHFGFNEETRSFSKAPEHDWSSHPSQAFAYGCQMIRGTPMPAREPQQRWTQVSETGQPHASQITLNDAWRTRTPPAKRI